MGSRLFCIFQNYFLEKQRESCGVQYKAKKRSVKGMKKMTIFEYLYGDVYYTDEYGNAYFDSCVDIDYELDEIPEIVNLGDHTYFEYYGAAEPPVRCGESHLSGLTEPPHFFIKLLCHCWVQSIYFSHREIFSWVNTFNIDLIGIIRYAIHDGIGKSTFTITDLLVPLTFTELRTKDC